MSYSIYFHPNAESEMNEAAEFLEQACPGFGTGFLTAVEKTVDQIALFPEATPLIL